MTGVDSFRPKAQNRRMAVWHQIRRCAEKIGNGRATPLPSPDADASLLPPRPARCAGIQSRFFASNFLAVASRSCALSKSSLPSQKSISNLASEIKCSIWKLKGRPRRRHMASSSARCSSDMRMLYWRVFLATDEACQTGFWDTCGIVIDNGMQCYNNRRIMLFLACLRKIWTGRKISHKIL